MFSSGTNPITLLRNLAAMGTVSCCHLHTEELPALADLDPEQCYLSWTVELASRCAEAELREVFEFVEHLAEIAFSRSDAPPQPVSNAGSEFNGRNRSSPQGLSPAQIAALRRLRNAARTPTAGSPQSSVTDRRQLPARPAAGGESSSIRVAIDKVDRLIDLVGELVIAHVMTAQMVEDFEPSCLPKLREAVAAMERNTRELHERVMGIRMLPVGTLFQKYTRTVYDIAQATGKQIRLELSGEETEIDKSMLELLGDPLTHLIRNSADHGIEAPCGAAGGGQAGRRRHQAEGLPPLGQNCHRDLRRWRGNRSGESAAQGNRARTDRRRSAIERRTTAMLIFEPGFSTRKRSAISPAAAWAWTWSSATSSR
jgi:two-component system chemotaxis sensor kinase CheA